MDWRREADWTPAEIRHGKLFVDLDLNGKKLDGILYDTGSSPDALAVDFSLWKEATGRSGTKDATTYANAQSWGRELEFIGAPASGDLKIGNHVYQRPLMTTVPAQPDSFQSEYGGVKAYWETRCSWGASLSSISEPIQDSES